MKTVINGAGIALVLSVVSAHAMMLTPMCAKIIGNGQHLAKECVDEIALMTPEERKASARLIGNGDPAKEEMASKIIGNGLTETLEASKIIGSSSPALAATTTPQQ